MGKFLTVKYHKISYLPKLDFRYTYEARIKPATYIYFSFETLQNSLKY